jgi:hypothetical protein
MRDSFDESSILSGCQWSRCRWSTQPIRVRRWFVDKMDIRPPTKSKDKLTTCIRSPHGVYFYFIEKESIPNTQQWWVESPSFGCDTMYTGFQFKSLVYYVHIW